MTKTILSYGEVLWDCLPDGKVLGGAPYNFAYRVHTLGHTGRIISRLGDDDLGHEARRIMDQAEVNTDWVQVDPTLPTGTVDVALDENRQPHYTINTGVAYDEIEADADVAQAFQNADCVCFGTLIQRSQKSRETLRHYLDQAPAAKKLYDINLRKDSYTPQIIEESLAYADILKLNEDEAEELKGMFGLSSTALPELAIELMSRFSLTECLITLGDRGLFAATSDGETTYVPGYAIDLVDPCGSGDACTAGYIVSRLEGSSLAESGEMGNALGAMVATHAGATTRVTREECRAFIQSSPKRIVDSMR